MEVLSFVPLAVEMVLPEDAQFVVVKSELVWSIKPVENDDQERTTVFGLVD